MLKHVLMFAICVALGTVPTMMLAQDAKDAHDEEVKAQVPALQKFHTPIYKLWHTAWPNKDTAMMASLCPDIDKGVAEIAAAELPGILRDKRGAWQESLKQLQDIASMYRTAMHRGSAETRCRGKTAHAIRKNGACDQAGDERDRCVPSGCST